MRPIRFIFPWYVLRRDIFALTENVDKEYCLLVFTEVERAYEFIRQHELDYSVHSIAGPRECESLLNGLDGTPATHLIVDYPFNRVKLPIRSARDVLSQTPDERPPFDDFVPATATEHRDGRSYPTRARISYPCYVPLSGNDEIVIAEVDEDFTFFVFNERGHCTAFQEKIEMGDKTMIVRNRVDLRDLAAQLAGETALSERPITHVVIGPDDDAGSISYKARLTTVIDEVERAFASCLTSPGVRGDY